RTSGARGGRRSRVVLTPRRWCQVCGDPQATEAIKPGTPGRARISRKTIARGMPECVRLYLLRTRVLCFAYFLHTRLRVQRHPAFPAPSLFGGLRSIAQAKFAP